MICGKVVKNVSKNILDMIVGKIGKSLHDNAFAMLRATSGNHVHLMFCMNIVEIFY